MRFDQPVGSQQARDAPTAYREWVEGPKFAQLYAVPTTGLQAYHTGSDLSAGLYDFGMPVYAAADGVVKRVLTDRWKGIIIVEHVLEDGLHMWTRYAHVVPSVSVGQAVKRGQQIATINDYYPPGASNDHLHYDTAKKNLALVPDDWPALDRARLLRDYVDPRLWINSHRSDEMVGAFSRVAYGRTFHVPWQGDAEFPQYPPATSAQCQAVWLKFCDQTQAGSPRHSYGSSFDDPALWIVDEQGNEGVRLINLWGFPDDPAVRAKYMGFFNLSVFHNAGAAVRWRAWSELSAVDYSFNVDPKVF